MLSFIKDKKGSEEFTSLPAISIVVIALALFIIILGNSYISFNKNIEKLEKYSDAYYVLEKITSDDSPIMKNGLVDYGALSKITINELNSYYNFDAKYGLILESNEIKIIKNLPHHSISSFSVYKNVAIYVSDEKIVYGRIGVVFYE